MPMNRRNRKFSSLLVFWILQSALCGLWAQERQGMASSNYLSTSALLLNPSSTADSWVYMQANLISGSGFVSSNTAYLPGFSPWKLIGGSVPEPAFKNPSGKEYATAVAGLEGPGFVISRDLYGLGFFTRVRSQGIIKALPYEAIEAILSDDPEKQFADHPDIALSDVSLSNMIWAEYGLNAAKMFPKGKNLWLIGTNLKYLTGVNVQYKFVNNLEAVYVDTNYQVIRLKATDRYNNPAWSSGRGVSGDFGFTYKRMLDRVDNYFANSPRSNCNYANYKYRISLSLNDLGALKFSKGTYVAQIDTETIAESLQQSYAEEMSEYYKTDQPIWAISPAGLVLQGDYNFENSLFLSALLIKNLVPDRIPGGRSSNLFSISPRFERKNFEVSLPFTLQRFVYPHLGLAFRFRSVVFGVDNIVPFLKSSNTQHFGLYFKFAWSMFRNPACNTKTRKVDDCRPGIRKGGIRKAKISTNENKKRKSKKRILTWK